MPKGTIVITGGSSPIGFETAKQLAEIGHSVVVGYHDSKLAADRVVNLIKQNGGIAHAFFVNTNDETSIAKLFSFADGLGKLHGLINGAAITGRQKDFCSLKRSEIEDVFKVNFMGSLICCQHAASRMSKKNGGEGGRIVNISSQAARSGGYRRVAYAASKAALETLTVSLASELANDEILVTAVSPGVINSFENKRVNSDWLKSAEAKVPLGRLGEPKEVASLLVWLMMPEANYITGTTIEINGGRRA